MQRKHTTLQRIQQNNNTRNYALPDDLKQMDVFDLVNFLASRRRLKLSGSAIRQYRKMLKCTRRSDWPAGNLCICWWSVQELAKELGITTRQVRYNKAPSVFRTGGALVSAVLLYSPSRTG